MKFIKDTIENLFSKKEKQELNLTKRQKKRYKEQYLQTMTWGALIFIALIWGLGESIVHFFLGKGFIYLALTVLFGLGIETNAIRTKNSIDLIEERIHKREKKNKRKT